MSRLALTILGEEPSEKPEMASWNYTRLRQGSQ